jgi:hypothetical protein
MEIGMRLVSGQRIKIETIPPYGNYICKDITPEPNGLDISCLNSLEPNPQLPKSPRALFQKLGKFFYDYASKNLEVHARVVFNPTNNEFRVFVPTQTIAGASVEEFDYTQAVDLETGESVSLPHRNYVTLWQFHVHPFHMPGPSGIDDNGFPGRPGTGELDRPGGYGIFSCWRKQDGYQSYTLRCTVVVSDGFQSCNKRLAIPTDSVVEGVSDGECIRVYNARYHENAHSVISQYVPKPVTQYLTTAPHQPHNIQGIDARYWDWNVKYSPITLEGIISDYSLQEILAVLAEKHSKAEILDLLNQVEE